MLTTKFSRMKSLFIVFLQNQGQIECIVKDQDGTKIDDLCFTCDVGSNLDKSKCMKLAEYIGRMIMFPNATVDIKTLGEHDVISELAITLGLTKIYEGIANPQGKKLISKDDIEGQIDRQIETEMIVRKAMEDNPHPEDN